MPSIPPEAELELTWPDKEAPRVLRRTSCLKTTRSVTASPSANDLLDVGAGPTAFDNNLMARKRRRAWPLWPTAGR